MIDNPKSVLMEMIKYTFASVYARHGRELKPSFLPSARNSRCLRLLEEYTVEDAKFDYEFYLGRVVTDERQKFVWSQIKTLIDRRAGIADAKCSPGAKTGPETGGIYSACRMR